MTKKDWLNLVSIQAGWLPHDHPGYSSRGARTYYSPQQQTAYWHACKLFILSGGPTEQIAMYDFLKYQAEAADD